MIYEPNNWSFKGQRIWHHPEPKPGEPHEPRNTPWPGDILRIHPNGAYLRVISSADHVSPYNSKEWVAYVWVKPFLLFWWRRISKYYIVPLAEWYNFVGNTDVVHVASKRRS